MLINYETNLHNGNPYIQHEHTTSMDTSDLDGRINLRLATIHGGGAPTNAHRAVLGPSLELGLGAGLGFQQD